PGRVQSANRALAKGAVSGRPRAEGRALRCDVQGRGSRVVRAGGAAIRGGGGGVGAGGVEGGPEEGAGVSGAPRGLTCAPFVSLAGSAVCHGRAATPPGRHVTE